MKEIIPYSNLSALLESIPREHMTMEVCNAFVKAWGRIHGREAVDGSEAWAEYKNIMVSISGGADSDIMLDLIERIGHPQSCVRYVFFNTGMEFRATLRHLDELEQTYGVKIERHRAKVPVPLGCQKYGIPFLNKKFSQFIYRLQKHGFRWEDKPFDELYKEYPHCKSALRWWCNMWGENGQCNIKNKPWLKEFMIQDPPQFRISNACCEGAKKKTAEQIRKDIAPDLDCQGVRKAEGGVRSMAYTSCFDQKAGGCDKFRPIFWMRKEDKEAYEQAFGLKHSDCYEVYGLQRTGCACCPFGRDWEFELQVAQKYEPDLYRAAMHVFGPSYEYTRRYMEFRRKMKEANR